MEFIRKFILGLAVVGIILALYLIFEQVTHSPFQPCNINSTVNCNAIISGAVAQTFGIPTPLIGLVGYIVIFFSAFFRKKKLLFGMATFGFVFCLWIAYQEVVLLHTICPVCLLCQADMLTTWILAVLFLKKKEL